MFLCIWIGFVIVYLPKNLQVDKSYFVEQYKALGKMSYEEIVVGIEFIVVAILWIFRSDISLGSLTIKGWANIFRKPSYISDGTCGMFMAYLLFVIPTKAKLQGKVGQNPETGEYNMPFVMTWETAKSLPWDLVLLFGGGFALAKACELSGLSIWLGDLLSSVGDLPKVYILSLLVFSSIHICIIHDNINKFYIKYCKYYYYFTYYCISS